MSEREPRQTRKHAQQELSEHRGKCHPQCVQCALLHQRLAPPKPTRVDFRVFS